MSLLVWLPLIRDNSNQGLIDLTPTNIGTVSFIDGGKFGKCLSAGNGTATTNGISYPTNLLDKLGTKFSCSIWVRPLGTHLHYNGTFVSSGDWNSKCWAFGVSQDNSQVDVFSKGYNRYITCSVPVNQWTHLCCTSDNGIVKLYKNGEYIGQRTESATLDSSATNFCVGRETYAGGYFSFNGNINDLRIYDEVLSPKQIKLLSQGLVCHYSLIGNRGLPNLAINSRALNISSAKTNLYVSKRGTSTVNYRNDGFFEVHCTTSWQGLSCWSNQLNLSVGDKITFSFYIYTNGVSNSYSFYPMMYNSSGTRDTSTTLPISIDGSAYVSANSRTFGATATIIPELHYATFEWNSAVKTIIDNGGSIELSIQVHGSNWSTGEVYLFKPKIERGEVPTIWQPNVNDSDYNILDYGSSLVYDSSGYNYHGTINTAQTISSTTARYSVSTNFNGTDNAIKIPFNAMLGLTVAGKTDYTISVWTYKTTIGSKGYQTILGGPSGFELEARNAAETNPVYVAWNWGKNTGTYEFNKWCLFTFVHTTTDNKIYVNGELASSGNAANVPIGDFFIGSWRDVSSQNYQGNMSDFRIYATALSADDVKELYQTSASIDKSGNMYTYEFNEV